MKLRLVAAVIFAGASEIAAAPQRYLLTLVKLRLRRSDICYASEIEACSRSDICYASEISDIALSCRADIIRLLI